MNVKIFTDTPTQKKEEWRSEADRVVEEGQCRINVLTSYRENKQETDPK
jgi:hypothetical protein